MPAARMSVVGGHDASISQFPFQVALYDPRAGSPAAGFFCGGVILDSTHVATAAHCVSEAEAGVPPSERIAVLAGSTTLNPQPASVTDPVLTSTVDAHYEPVTSDYDVALLTLAHPLWSGTAQPGLNGVNRIAPLPADRALAASAGNPNLTPATMATASGWGDLYPAPSHRAAYPDGLRAVQMPLVSDATCAGQYSLIEQVITPRMICAGGGRSHRDTCYGDSGGPLVADSHDPPNPPYDYVLVGLVDFGNGCAQAGYAGVYTRVSSPAIAGFLALGSGARARSSGAPAKHRRKRHRRHRRGHGGPPHSHRRPA